MPSTKTQTASPRRPENRKKGRRLRYRIGTRKQSYEYDTADRLIGEGIEYDNLGPITSVASKIRAARGCALSTACPGAGRGEPVEVGYWSAVAVIGGLRRPLLRADLRKVRLVPTRPPRASLQSAG